MRSPYSGEVVGRVSKAGADQARQAWTRPQRRCRNHCLRTSEPRSSSRSRLHLDADMTRSPCLISDEAGKPMKAARVEATARDVDIHLRGSRGAQARRRDGADGRGSGGRRETRVSRCVARSASSARSSPFNFPLNLVAHKLAPALAAGCAVVLKPARQTPLSALAACRSRDGSRATARLDQRRRRSSVRARRRARRRPPREADHLHRFEWRRLGATRARPAKSASTSSSAMRHPSSSRRMQTSSPGGDEGGTERVLVRRAELYLPCSAYTSNGTHTTTSLPS